jgi:hypothetical protein
LVICAVLPPLGLLARIAVEESEMVRVLGVGHDVHSFGSLEDRWCPTPSMLTTSTVSG